MWNMKNTIGTTDTIDKRAKCKLVHICYVSFLLNQVWILANPDNGIDLEIVDPEEMQDTYGTTNTGNNIMRIRSDVYEGAIMGDPRHRFTLCHEVGHYFLHQPDSVSFARGNIPRYREPEWQANTFAAELMAPYDLVKDMDVEEIMEKCGMSRQAATIQYYEYHR